MPLATQFPAALDSDTDETKLKDGQTPDAYGLGIDAPGLLMAGTVPTSAARIVKTYTIAPPPEEWTWYYRRLWRASAANLLFNAPEYTASLVRHGLGALSFDEDAEPIVTFFPFAADSMFVAKSTGGYSVPGADRMSDRYIDELQHGNIVPSLKVAAAANATELDQLAFVSNAGGLYSWDGRTASELTGNLKVRIATFQSCALTLDVANRRIVGRRATEPTALWAYDLDAKAFYDYSTAGFRFTSRTLAAAGKPLQIVKVGFLYENTTKDDGELTLQVRRDMDWEDEIVCPLRWKETTRAWYEQSMPNVDAARKFTVRLTALSANIRIRQILVNGQGIVAEEGRSQ
jgi:hypothetical protein